MIDEWNLPVAFILFLASNNVVISLSVEDYPFKTSPLQLWSP